ncbi:hypothetical protein ACIQPP_05420 [Streptomyces violaceusniger]|uniref:hypothetical protein n=1 Tax=Streptomyces violaceusniger TaxID=68280 RepID=UPI000997FE18|nr:hypothetical protein [Streptomyces hygroscopicus]AQW55260.1 hypothetical protein SHXM_08723 [Streptomyces hygroscopicus]
MIPSTARSRIPGAVAAVIAAVVAEHPHADPHAIGRLAVHALTDEGWHISAVPDHVDEESTPAAVRPCERPARASTALNTHSRPYASQTLTEHAK